MCLIIDNDVSHEFVSHEICDAAAKLIHSIEQGRTVVIYRGKLTDELLKNHHFAAWITELSRSGKAREVSRSQVDPEQAIIEEAGHCGSNDTHIIALARVSGARWLYSRDSALIQDFKKKTLIDKPRGRIYSRPEHAPLLERHPCKCRESSEA